MKTTDNTTDVRMCIQGKETTLFVDAVLPACDWSRIILVFEALSSACEKHPTWPTDPMHALAMLAEELGKLTREVLQATYEPEKGATLESITREKRHRPPRWRCGFF